MVAIDFCYKILGAGVLCLVCVAFVITFNRVHICDNVPVSPKTPSPPKPGNIACMARYVVHESDWCSISYIIQRHNVSGYPASRIYSISDGNINTTTGDVYFMVSPMDESVLDLEENNACSIIMTLDQGGYCKQKQLDTEDPRCAQVGITGRFTKIPGNSSEWYTARDALWSRHEIMKEWWYIVPYHKFFFAKISIEFIFIVDYFGGRKFPSVADYYNATECLKNLKTHY